MLRGICYEYAKIESSVLYGVQLISVFSVSEFTKVPFSGKQITLHELLYLLFLKVETFCHFPYGSLFVTCYYDFRHLSRLYIVSGHIVDLLPQLLFYNRRFFSGGELFSGLHQRKGSVR